MRVTFKILISAVSIIVLAACSGQGNTQHLEMSRVKAFHSVSELAHESTVVVVGKVVGQSESFDVDPEIPVTISKIKVEGHKKGMSPAFVLVRQIAGGVGDSEVHLLEVGRSYLLYLTASGLDGKLGKQFYITGVDSGIFEATVTTESDNKYKRTSHLDGDVLPETVSESESLG